MKIMERAVRLCVGYKMDLVSLHVLNNDGMLNKLLYVYQKQIKSPVDRMHSSTNFPNEWWNTNLLEQSFIICTFVQIKYILRLQIA
jgi:hypothetical protein